MPKVNISFGCLLVVFHDIDRHNTLIGKILHCKVATSIIIKNWHLQNIQNDVS